MEQEEFIIPEINPEDLIPEEEIQDDPIEDTKEDDIQEEEESTEDEVIKESDIPDDIHTPLYKWSVDNNFFFNKSEDELKEAPKTPEEFFQLVEERNQEFDKLRAKQVDELVINKFPEYLRPIIKAAKDSPDPIPKEAFAELLNVAEQVQIDPEKFESDDTLAEDYIRNSYKEASYDDEEIEDIVATLKDKGTLGKRAKSLFERDSKQGNEVINNFISTVNTRVQEDKDQVETFKNEFSSALKDTGWREDKIKAVQHNFESGEYYRRLEHALNNPKVAPLLVDFLNYYDGSTIHLDKYAKHGFNTTKRKVEQEIDKKSKRQYFNNKTTTKRSNRDQDTLGGMNLDNLQIVTK